MHNTNYVLLLESLLDSSIDLQEEQSAMSILISRAKQDDSKAKATVREVYQRLTGDQGLIESTCCHAPPTGQWPKSDLCSFCLDHSTFTPKESLFNS